MHQAIVDQYPAPSQTPDVMQLSSRAPEYRTLRFTEKNNRALATAAHWLHASGYNEKKFVEDEAVKADGLAGDLDHSRGPDFDYYMTGRHYEGDDEITVLEAATLRKKNLSPSIIFNSRAYKRLPGVQLSGDNINAEGLEILRTTNPSRLKEITALATRRQKYTLEGELIDHKEDREANPLAVYHLIRTVIHEALGKDEVWFFAIVDRTHDSLVENFGEQAVKRVGDDFDLEDPLVRKGIRLRPAITHVDSFIRNIHNSYKDAVESRDWQQAKRYGRSFVFFSEGLGEDKLDADLIEERDKLLGLHAKQAS